MTDDHASTTWVRLAHVLLQFAQTPGRYSMSLREPRELYTQMDSVALWALGRLPESLREENSGRLQTAAITFIQRACFGLDNNHYQVLGLGRDEFTANDLRARYRALIRLTHPDMGVPGLPTNAAGMVNRAHEVLSNPIAREQYDSTLAMQSPMHWPGAANQPLAEDREVRLTTLNSLEESSWWNIRSRITVRYASQIRVSAALATITVIALILILWSADDPSDKRMLVVTASNRLATAQTHRLVAAPSPLKSRGPAESVTADTAGKLDSYGRTSDRLILKSARSLNVGAAAGTVASTPPALATPAFAPSMRESVPARDNRTVSVASVEQLANDVAGASEETRRALPPPFARPKNSSGRAAATSAGLETPVASTIIGTQRPVAAIPQPIVAPVNVLVTNAREPLVGRSADQEFIREATTTLAVTSAHPSNQAIAAVAPPVTTSRVTTWNVDAPGARRYLTNLLGNIERPSDAQQANAHLEKMNVQGSLLGQALRSTRQHHGIRIERVALSEIERPGALSMTGTVMARATELSGSTSLPVKFRLRAEFVGTRNGTALSQLDVSEVEQE